MKLTKAVALALVCISILVLAAPALAATPAQSAYGGLSSTQLTPGTLPFTGIDVGAVALLGVLLIGAGFAVRRRARTSNE